MASGWFNKGKEKVLKYYFQGTEAPGASLYTTLLTGSLPAGTEDTLSALNEITPVDATTIGGRDAKTRNATQFAGSLSTNTYVITLTDVVFTAGSAGINVVTASCLVATDGAAADVIAWFDLGGSTTVSTGQTLTIQNQKLQLT